MLPGLCGGVFMGKQTGRIASVPLCGCSEGSVNILPAFLLCSGCFLRTWPVHPPVSFRMTYHSPGRRLKGIAILHLPLHPPRLETQFRHHLLEGISSLSHFSHHSLLSTTDVSFVGHILKVSNVPQWITVVTLHICLPYLKAGPFVLLCTLKHAQCLVQRKFWTQMH